MGLGILMKKILLLTAAMLTSALHVQAQNIEVVDFRYLASDLSAQMHEYEKFDQNGERAAIIKIVTSERDFTFDAGFRKCFNESKRFYRKYRRKKFS